MAMVATKTVAKRVRMSMTYRPGWYQVREDGALLSEWPTQREAYDSLSRVADGWERDGFDVEIVLC